MAWVVRTAHDPIRRTAWWCGDLKRFLKRYSDQQWAFTNGESVPSKVTRYADKADAVAMALVLGDGLVIEEISEPQCTCGSEATAATTGEP